MMAIVLAVQARADEGNDSTPKVIELKEVNLVEMAAKDEVQWTGKGINLGDFLRGHMNSKTYAVPIGDLDSRKEHDELEACRECRLPVGDYMPSWVTFNYGNLRLFVSESYHSDGRPRDSTRQRQYAIQIPRISPSYSTFPTNRTSCSRFPAKTPNSNQATRWR